MGHVGKVGIVSCVGIQVHYANAKISPSVRRRTQAIVSVLEVSLRAGDHLHFNCLKSRLHITCFLSVSRGYFLVECGRVIVSVLIVCNIKNVTSALL